MKKYFLLFVTSLVLLYGQTDSVKTKNKAVATNVIRLTLLKPIGVSFDFRLNDRLVTTHTLGISYYRDYMKRDKLAFITYPAYEAHLKYFYNFNKRMAKGKRTSYNSGNYIGITYSPAVNPFGYGSSLFSDTYYGIGAIYWGLQRTIGKKELFYFDLNLGIRYNFNAYSIKTPSLMHLSPDIRFRFGLNLNSLRAF